ncbi:DUF3958 family protein [Streptococcus merionis]|uniref:DUF3958 family protein n=1 Tax=Streptococcus merionis TaxID=400065 RepID=UPI0035135E24
MDKNELLNTEKKLSEQADYIQKKMKENQASREEFYQLSKEGQAFFQETLGFLQGSSDRHIFQALYDEQTSLDKKVKVDFEQEYDELQQEYRGVITQKEEITLQRRRLEKEEKDGN